MKICAKGVWDESIPEITFDANGVSNYCHLQERMMADYPRGVQGEKEWQHLVEQMKQAGKNKRYDCIVGVSGGVDSSYLLHICHRYGLRPLAVNLDNGFNSEIAVQNIYKVTKQLNIDLETYVVDYEEMKDLLKSYMKAALPWVDVPTDLAIKAVMYKIANQEGVKFIIRGNDFRSEGKQPTEWTYADYKQLKYIHNTFGSGIKLKTYPTLPLLKMAYFGFVKKIKDIRPFYYLNYSKQEAKKLLIEEYGWQDYGGHHHENLFTKFAIAYWLPLKFNIDKRKINLSAQVLSNAITRKEALEELAKPFDSFENLEKLKDYTIKKLYISQSEFQQMMIAKEKHYTDYPSYYNLIYKNIKYVKWLLAKLYNYKPMSIVSSEVLAGGKDKTGI